MKDFNNKDLGKVWMENISMKKDNNKKLNF